MALRSSGQQEVEEGGQVPGEVPFNLKALWQLQKGMGSEPSVKLLQEAAAEGACSVTVQW